MLISADFESSNGLIHKCSECGHVERFAQVKIPSVSKCVSGNGCHYELRLDGDVFKFVKPPSDAAIRAYIIDGKPIEGERIKEEPIAKEMKAPRRRKAVDKD